MLEGTCNRCDANLRRVLLSDSRQRILGASQIGSSKKNRCQLPDSAFGAWAFQYVFTMLEFLSGSLCSVWSPQYSLLRLERGHVQAHSISESWSCCQSCVVRTCTRSSQPLGTSSLMVVSSFSCVFRIGAALRSQDQSDIFLLCTDIEGPSDWSNSQHTSAVQHCAVLALSLR